MRPRQGVLKRGLKCKYDLFISLDVNSKNPSTIVLYESIKLIIQRLLCLFKTLLW